MTGAALAWLAHVTAFLQPYAPFSWGIAALIGAIGFALAVLVIAHIRSAIVTASIRRKFYEGSEKLNPVVSQFQEQRIFVSDLVPPFELVIRNKTFIKCEIIGPANVVLSGPGLIKDSSIINCAASKMSDKSQFIPASVMFENCQFLECKLVNLLFLVPSSAQAKFTKDLLGIHWITD